MAQLIRHNGRYYKGEPGKWQEIDVDQYFQEASDQQRIQQQGIGERAMAGYSYYVKNLLSGARELTYGDPAEEQQFRAQVQEDYGPHLEYGGFPVTAGQFGGGASTALLPGGLKAQMAIGAGQGAAESPDQPLMGAGLGAALTWAGDWAAEGVGRITRTLRTRRAALDPDYAARLQRGMDEGLQFTPGQLADDPARRMMEKQLMKNPRYAQADLDRFLSNQTALNNAAARSIGQTPTGRVTPGMRGRAAEQVGEAFDAVATESAPIDILGKDYIEVVKDMTQMGQDLNTRFMKRFPNLFKGEPVSGKEFIDARNWLAKQTRQTSNIISGASEEMQPILAVLDNSLEDSNVRAGKELLVDEIVRARQKWKALLVIEDSLRGAKQAAGGNISAASAYQALKKYDKGGVYRGRARDPFATIVDAMAAADDVAPAVMPSTDMGQGGIMRTMMDALYTAPAVERYMRGENIGKVMLGQLEEAGPVTRAMQGAGIGTPRGIMALEDEQ